MGLKKIKEMNEQHYNPESSVQLSELAEELKGIEQHLTDFMENSVDSEEVGKNLTPFIQKLSAYLAGRE